MTRHRSRNKATSKHLRETSSKPPNVLQANRNVNKSNNTDNELVSDEIVNIKSILSDDHDACDLVAGTSSSNDKDLNTASLHSELDSFRQRWKRELETKNSDTSENQTDKDLNLKNNDEEKENRFESQNLNTKEFYAAISNPPDNPRDLYALAKKLFLIGVELEQDDLHHESIRYYKQAMHLYPDIERQIFREQSEASIKSNSDSASQNEKLKIDEISKQEIIDKETSPLYERISSALSESLGTDGFYYCRPTHKHKPHTRHISELPRDLLLQIFRYLVGQDLDLASLETMGLVCRGFYLLSRDTSLWRSICYRTWGDEIFYAVDKIKDRNQIDWRRIYLERPRVNCDGVYISRTRYIRQGDVGFQDVTYRPFHVIRYYRYLRCFPDKRVLILTTNEEPEKIIPIFRHASHAKQFSPELSILEGSYDLVDTNQLVIVAEKDFSLDRDQNRQPGLGQKRHGRFHWSRQTPLSQRFDYKFQLKTVESRPFRNNTLKWIDYTITSRLETGQEITSFDLSSDSFPNLTFCRVKRFNLKQTEPLASH
jgi:F-box protein 9